MLGVVIVLSRILPNWKPFWQYLVNNCQITRLRSIYHCLSLQYIHNLHWSLVSHKHCDNVSETRWESTVKNFTSMTSWKHVEHVFVDCRKRSIWPLTWPDFGHSGRWGFGMLFVLLGKVGATLLHCSKKKKPKVW